MQHIWSLIVSIVVIMQLLCLNRSVRTLYHSSYVAQRVSRHSLHRYHFSAFTTCVNDRKKIISSSVLQFSSTSHDQSESPEVTESLSDDSNNSNDSEDDPLDEFSTPIEIAAAKESREGSLRLKVRQHVNPLSNTYMEPLRLSSTWLQDSFSNPTQPIHIDIGCAHGSWALKYATINPSINVLGLEIRRPVVDLCLRRKQYWNVSNVHFLSSNANVDLDYLLTSLQSHHVSVQAITVQFPDPHFKKRHQKRRVVNEALVNIMAKYLPAGGRVFVQSDILDAQEDMVRHLHSSPYFFSAEGYDVSNLEANKSPFNVLTEREIATQKKGLPVYRMLFKRNGVPFQAM